MDEPDRLIADYQRHRPRSVAWHARAIGYFAADGATHFARVNRPFRPYIVRAKGARKWDADGHEYLDYVMGHGALILGHGHPAIVEAIQRQTACGLHYGDNHELEVQWAERIRGLMPAAERVEFFASGMEANLMGIRMSRAATGRRGVLRLAHNYHGWADELAPPGTPGAVADHVTVIPGNDLALAERHLASREFAVMLVEGGGGRLSGRIPTDPDYVRVLPALTRAAGTVFHLDEVVTGFREAPGGWQSVLGIEPDLTSVGKAVSGGVAAGALLGRADILDALDPAATPGRRVLHGGTWNAVPIACAAGIAACGLYADGTPQRVAAARAAALREDANARLARRGLPLRLFGRSIVHVYAGPIVAAPDGGPPAPDLARLIDPAVTPTYHRFDLHLLARGVASLRGEAFILSGAHSEGDVAGTAAAIEDAALAMAREGALPD